MMRAFSKYKKLSIIVFLLVGIYSGDLIVENYRLFYCSSEHRVQDPEALKTLALEIWNRSTGQLHRTPDEISFETKLARRIYWFGSVWDYTLSSKKYDKSHAYIVISDCGVVVSVDIFE